MFTISQYYQCNPCTCNIKIPLNVGFFFIDTKEKCSKFLLETNKKKGGKRETKRKATANTLSNLQNKKKGNCSYSSCNGSNSHGLSDQRQCPVKFCPVWL